MNRLQSVDDEGRQQQHYASQGDDEATRSGQNHARQRRQVHRLRARLLAHAQRVAVLVRHRDARARLLEAHQVHVRSASARHGEPRDALRVNEEGKESPCPADHRRPSSPPACCRREPHPLTRRWRSSTPSGCPCCWTPWRCCGCCS